MRDLEPGVLPDGRHLAGARYENRTASRVVVLDRDLQEVGRHEPEALVSAVAWQDAEHLLVAQGGVRGTTWTWMRVSLDAAQVEMVGSPVAGPLPEMGTAFLPSR